MHTPGPWRWWTSNSYRRLTSEAGRGGTDGGVLRGSVQRDGTADVIASPHDMGLIAAAPDLLESARLALSRLDHHMGDTDPNDDMDPDVIACRALADAITKAQTPVER